MEANQRKDEEAKKNREDVMDILNANNVVQAAYTLEGKKSSTLVPPFHSNEKTPHHWKSVTIDPNFAYVGIPRQVW